MSNEDRERHVVVVHRVQALGCGEHTTLLAVCSCGWRDRRRPYGLGGDERSVISDRVQGHKLAALLEKVGLDFRVVYNTEVTVTAEITALMVERA